VEIVDIRRWAAGKPRRQGRPPSLDTSLTSGNSPRQGMVPRHRMQRRDTPLRRKSFAPRKIRLHRRQIGNAQCTPLTEGLSSPIDYQHDRGVPNPQRLEAHLSGVRRMARSGCIGDWFSPAELSHWGQAMTKSSEFPSIELTKAAKTQCQPETESLAMMTDSRTATPTRRRDAGWTSKAQ